LSTIKLTCKQQYLDLALLGASRNFLFGSACVFSLETHIEMLTIASTSAFHWFHQHLNLVEFHTSMIDVNRITMAMYKTITCSKKLLEKSFDLGKKFATAEIQTISQICTL